MSVYCPTHGTELDGGPNKYTCRHGHGVNAADISTKPGRPQL